MSHECFEVSVEDHVAQARLSRPERMNAMTLALAVARRIATKVPIAVSATKQMISYTRDHSVAESFDYLNALQPGIFSVEDIRRAVAAGKSGTPAAFADLPALAMQQGA